MLFHIKTCVVQQQYIKKFIVFFPQGDMTFIYIRTDDIVNPFYLTCPKRQPSHAIFVHLQERGGKTAVLVGYTTFFPFFSLSTIYPPIIQK